MAVLMGGYNLVSAGRILLVIVLAEHMRASAFSIGLIFSVGGITGIFGAQTATFIQKRFKFGQIIIAVSWLMTLLLPLYIFSYNVVFLMTTTAVISFVFPSYDIVQFSYRTAIIPDELQGRVNSFFRLIAIGGQPLGYALTGSLIQTINVIPTVLILSIGFIILAFTATLSSSIHHARPLIATQNLP